MKLVEYMEYKTYCAKNGVHPPYDYFTWLLMQTQF